MIRIFAVLLLALPAAGCAGPQILPGTPRDVREYPMPPYEVHEECVSMNRGDEIAWRFSAAAPLRFSIHYRDGKALVMPVVRNRTAAESGAFVALVKQHYCLTWEAGAQGTPLDYTVELRRAPR